MGSNPRQLKLTDIWTSGRGRGRGRGMRIVPSIHTHNHGGTRGQIGSSRGTPTTFNRGRRGRDVAASTSLGPQPSSSSTSTYVGGFDDDEDEDILCIQALSNYELVANEVSRAFENVNKSKELPGFDTITGNIWIYPINKPVRDYQFNIVQTALYHNTMVSLPTGLGKTFIAAVIMYNFHRWYPNNLIVFMAPTKPLVAQQLDACKDLIGIHPSKMVELTGNITPNQRAIFWKEKKVFFLTPQVMLSDLGRGFWSPEQIRCIVVDEAHKSLGNHAYAQVVKMIVEKNKYFRILALTATPGNDLLAVNQVLKNLLISKIEIRDETSLDILPYTYQKQIETIVVPLDDHINSVHKEIIEIFKKYTGKLMKQNVLSGRDGFSFTQFQLIKARETYRQKQKPGLANYQKGYIENDFATCITIAHGIDLLLNYGLRSFHTFFHCVLCKEKGSPLVAFELKISTNLEQILQKIQDKLNISIENSFFDLSTSGLFTTCLKSSTKALPDPRNPEDYLLSHPKMRILRDLVEKHFGLNLSGTRIMIFSEYRDSVQEIGNMLNSLRPLVKPMIFLGQSKGVGIGGRGLRQKEQIQIIQSFRNGEFNVLVSTCVGEEGLDIGEVDLIICFDGSKNPTRLVQRMGRTGRRREGKAIFLLTEGRAEKMYSNNIGQQQYISKGITDTSIFEQVLYKESPRMIPAGMVPQCFKMNIILSSEQSRSQVGDEPEIIEINDDVPTTSKNVKSGIIHSKERERTSDSSNSPYIPQDSKNDEDFENMEQEETKVTNWEDDLKLSEIGTDYQKYLKELIGINDVEPGTIKNCVFVPKLPRTKMNFTDFDMSNFDEIAKELDVGRLREKLNSVYMLGPPSNRCDCGLLLVDDDMMNVEQTDNEDFGGEVSIPVQNTEPKMGLSILHNYSPVENPVMNQVETENMMTDSSDSQLSPILKRMSFDQSVPKALWKETSPKGNTTTLETSDSPDEYPPSPPFQRRPVLRATSTAESPDEYPPTPPLPRHCPLKISRSIPPTVTVTITKEPLQKQVTSPQNSKSSPESSDATYYESDNSNDDLLSPILTFEKIQTPVPFPKEILSTENIAEFQVENPIQNTTERKEGNDVQKTLRVVTGLQDNPTVSDSQHSYQQSETIEKKPTGSRKVFTFRKKTETVTVLIPFNELPNILSPPPAVNENRDTSTQDPFPISSFSDSDEEFFIPRYQTSGSVNRSGESSQSGPSGQQERKLTKRNTTRKRKRKGIGFILEEAEVVDNETSTTNSSDSDSTDNSFVDDEESSSNVTESQQVRYIKSTKKPPKMKFGAKKTLDEIALERIEKQGMEEMDLTDYQDEELTSQFCVSNDFVEHTTVGDFTQKMNEARVAVQLEAQSTRFKRTLRSETRKDNEREKERMEECKSSTTKPGRKRILVISSDESE